MIVREEPGSFVLVKQHDHALVSGEFARHWREEPRPSGSTLFAVANHDLAWQKLDERVLWDEASGKPYSFVTYPTGPKLRAYGEGLDLLESQNQYAACLCSMHYATIVGGSGGEAEERFVEAETARQQRLKDGMSEMELENLEYNLYFLKLCDGLSLFICLNQPGESENPPPYPGGLELQGARFEPVWQDRGTLSLSPNPFSEPFDVAVPYSRVGRDGRSLGSDHLRLRVAC